MEVSRLRLLFLIVAAATALPGCAALGAAGADQQAAIDLDDLALQAGGGTHAPGTGFLRQAAHRGLSGGVAGVAAGLGADAAGGTGFAREVLDRIAGEDAARAVASLPDEFRVVATLYFMDDFSYQEIASVLDVPVGTVRSRLHRGRKLLQKALWEVATDAGLVPATSEDEG